MIRSLLARALISAAALREQLRDTSEADAKERLRRALTEKP